MMEIDLPEVQSFAQKPRFYKDGNRDLVEISLIGSPDTIVQRVTPEHMARFREEWNAYCDGRPMEQRKGTPLTTLPEITEEMAKSFVERNLHTLEELAVLNDHQCQGLGHGLLTLRKKAQHLVMSRQMAEKEQGYNRISSQMAKAASASEQEANAEVNELKDIVKEQGKQLAALTELLTKMAEPRKPGRPRKDANGAKLSS